MRSAAHRDEPQVGTVVIRQRRVRLAAMRSERAASDLEKTLGRTSLLILAALSLAAVAWRGDRFCPVANRGLRH
jgi:hypothetical protein